MESQVTDRAPTTDEVEAWSKLCFLILETYAKHAVSCGSEERQTFEQRLEEVTAGLKDHPSASQVLIAAGSLIHTIQEHGRQTQKQSDATTHGLREITQLLLTHTASVHQGQASATQLEELRSEWSQTSESAFPVFQAKLEACLGVALTEVAASKTNEHRPVAKANIAPVSTVDPCTGLPLRVDAEAAIQRAMEDPAQYYLATFYVHRMNLTNARFGEGIGNQVIMFCSQHIAGRLTKTDDAMFRWMGPAFVAILRREESELSVLSEIQRVASTPLSRFFETSSRTVYLPMKLSGEAFSLQSKTYEEVRERLEKFILRCSQTAE